MSPARSKRQAVPHRRSRADIVKAVSVSAGIVVATSLLVWLLRPGPSGIPATGGLMNRQPRASWLVSGGLGVGGLAAWFIVRGRRTRARAKLLLPIALAVVLIAAVIGGFAWPGGLLRHDVAPKPAPTTTTTTTLPHGTSTTAVGGTSLPGGTGGSGATSNSTTPTTAAATTAPAGGTSAPITTATGSPVTSAPSTGSP